MDFVVVRKKATKAIAMYEVTSLKADKDGQTTREVAIREKLKKVKSGVFIKLTIHQFLQTDQRAGNPLRFCRQV